MVALELVRHSIQAHHQVRIFEYSVDFVMPEYKVVLEADGTIFHGKEKLSLSLLPWNLRDVALRCFALLFYRLYFSNIN